MEIQIGRLIDHVHIVVSDLEKSRAFYRAALASIGRSLNLDVPHAFGSDELFVSQIDSNSQLSHVHLAFQAKDRATVDAFYKAALAVGGRPNGEPGERKYHPGYYGAFVLDPDGNNIEAVFHGPTQRSTDSIKITSPK